MFNDGVIANPFPGLRAFEEEEDILFFGREKQIDELLRKLRTSRFLAIIGSSGSGKSSLVKSGLLPSLHSGLMSGAGSSWRIALFRPGSDPIGQLNEALSRNGVLRDNQTKEDLEINLPMNESILRRSNLGLVELYKQSGLDKRNNLLVLVDQFEELFRFSKYERDAKEGKRDSIAFINLLLQASEQKEFPIYVVFTMRSDFLGDCTEFRGLPEAINEGQYLVPRMTREERRDAITGPIAVGHASITPALLNRLLNDVGDNPDQLPILQHALMRTWDSWKEKKKPDSSIDINDYETIGTITEALSQHAEEAYSELSGDRERQICERIFKELTDKSGLSHGVRRPRLLSELAAAADATPEEIIKVVEVFRRPGRGFLMPAAPAKLTPSSIIDISHESLMRVWKRLITWLEEEEESAQIYLNLCEAVDLYESGKGGLWRDPELQIAIKWRESQNKNAAWAVRYNDHFDRVMFFLEHSRQQRDLEIRHKEEMARQRLKTTRRITVVVSVIALVAFLFGIWAFNLKMIATKAGKEAESQRNEAVAQKQQADVSRAAAIEAKGIAEVARDSAERSKEIAIEQERNALIQKGIAVTESARAKAEKENAERSAQEALESKKVAVENAEIAERNRQEAERNKLKAVTEKEKAERLQKLAESKNEAHKAVMYMNDSDYTNSLRLSLAAYNSNLNNQGDFQDDDIYGALYLGWQNSIQDKNTFTVHNAPVRSLVGLPRTDIVYSADENGVIVTSQNNGGVLVKKSQVNAGGEVRAISVDASGGYLLAVLVKEAVLYKIGGDHSLQKFTTVKYSGYGRHGAFLGSRHFVVQSTTGVSRFEVTKSPATNDTVSVPNCAAILTTDDGKIFIAAAKTISEYNSWEGVRGTPVNTYTLASHITSLAMDRSGHYLAAGTYAGGIWLKNRNSQSAPSYSVLHHSAVNDLKFSDIPGGHLQLSSASSDRAVKLIEVKEGRLNTDNIITLYDHTNWVYALVYSPDGKYLFSGAEDQLVTGRPTSMAILYNTLTNKK